MSSSSFAEKLYLSLGNAPTNRQLTVINSNRGDRLALNQFPDYFCTTNMLLCQF
ncbi:hypothetical protein [Synechocystis salina]|uniref:Uncharacterized protein n=1 Tax=Synechocystis salina LEGE 00031 TaxID=1828736 RepID=A0ABR9VTA6_9SYNC|nr:hypothetical protein [Synechocystis salina]MBE9240816.1 hypothetical protein [Synechocystis salina LEGE 00041]MBE9254276.1 hypothetical protein [Synechocystis salina LEGE 00031]